MTGDPARRPPRQVLQTLRQEVGFRCPVSNCGNPYLTWHHFDPPWRVEKHHRPMGMIALCQEHAAKADNGSFTDDQLRELKRRGRIQSFMVQGRFDWMRRDLLAVVGGNFYYRQRVILQINGFPVIWFNRDEQGSLLLNFTLPSSTARPGIRLEDNVWLVPPTVEELICPPNGRLIDVKHSGGYRFKVEFTEVRTPDQLAEKYPSRGRAWWASQILAFPLAVVKLWESCDPAFGLEVGRKGTLFGSGSRVTDTFFRNNDGPALELTAPQSIFEESFPSKTDSPPGE